MRTARSDRPVPLAAPPHNRWASILSASRTKDVQEIHRINAASEGKGLDHLRVRSPDCGTDSRAVACVMGHELQSTLRNIVPSPSGYEQSAASVAPRTVRASRLSTQLFVFFDQFKTVRTVLVVPLFLCVLGAELTIPLSELDRTIG